MMPLFRWFLLPLMAGVLLAYISLSLTGLLLAFLPKNYYFGLDIHTVIILLVYIPLPLLLGIPIGYFSQHRAIAAGFTTTAYAMMVMVVWILISFLQKQGDQFYSPWHFILIILLSPETLLMALIPIGAYAGARWRQIRKSRHQLLSE